MHDIRYVIIHCVLSFVGSRVLYFLFLGDDAVIDRYDFLGYGSEYEEHDDEW